MEQLNNIKVAYNLLPWREQIVRKSLFFFILQSLIIISISCSTVYIINYNLHLLHSDLSHKQIQLQSLKKQVSQILQQHNNIQNLRQIKTNILNNKESLLWINSNLTAIKQLLTHFPISNGNLTQVKLELLHLNYLHKFENRIEVDGMLSDNKKLSLLLKYFKNQLNNFIDKQNITNKHLKHSEKISKHNQNMFHYQVSFLLNTNQYENE